MSRPFTNISSANKTFGQFKEPKDASEYIYNKKARATFCIANKCAPSIKVYSESDRLLFNRSNQLSLYPCADGIDTANLNINLITRLNLRNVPVIQDASFGMVPSTITLDSIPFLDYVIDPSGALFGNSVCGINNFMHYIRPNIQFSPYIIISGDYEITGDSSYNTIITFFSNSVIEFTKPINIDYIIVGGGGGAGVLPATKYGGGGGGQVKTGTFNTSLEKFTISIGAGGAGASSGAIGQNGVKSSIVSTSITIDASGGFGTTSNGNGGNSGAGGAGGIYYDGSANPPPTYINGVNGGGGAAGSGQRTLAGNGGYNSINPNYGGGGGGGSGNGFIFGGIGVGGGGNGGNTSLSGNNATPNTGGGGGGAGYGYNGTSGGNGGSGVVIFSFNV